MKKTIIIKDIQTSYAIRRSRRAKRISLTVSRAGEFSVTVPRFWIGEYKILKFIKEKENWILKAFKKVGNRLDLPVNCTRKSAYKKYKDEALSFAMARAEELNARYGFNYRKITIRNQKSRWGSCSADKNLNFNYRILFLPAALADYIIVHELCHLAEMNHSKKFWALVAKAVPDHGERRKKLRKYAL